jgi:hypothetical protein
LATRWVPLQGFSNASSLLPPCPSFPGARGLKYEMHSPGSSPGLQISGLREHSDHSSMFCIC